MYHFLIGPLVGAIIGYITNDIAIRMLFRPHTAKYILGIKVPFTPGIIPKEKSRIATAIGGAISNNLMNREVLEASLLSDDMFEKMGAAIDEFVATQSTNEETLESFAKHYLNANDISTMQSHVTEGVIKMIADKLQNAQVGTQIAHLATEHALEKTRNSMAGRLGAEFVVNALAQPIEKLLSKHINEILRDHAEPMISGLVDAESKQLMSLKMSAIVTNHKEQLAQIKSSIFSAYRVIISEHLPRILQDINISQIVEDRINDMDMDEAEAIIFAVMKKELRAIVWLGALLGAIMGTLNSLL